jgi:hypothetical protein
MRRFFLVLFVIVLIIVAFFTFRQQPPFPRVAGTYVALDMVKSLLGS